ncbi:conserved Plasmodium protein, unknown function [Plasmodium sp. gorilla clade G2]|uniref:conserved Plasmodium protein, unknown function n=1 Tax=Plasmodium sp. gorilla clade G2 TaxID=880535 RepID=UPI000D21D116|nr:conserved Plasmodium protein, unknown function [Plasmodium sp. gorilla clade G2]SOV12661.1 conserved Plasmodium protein, unknown function [Plasmodium sp. gorilla clade G2]
MENGGGSFSFDMLDMINSNYNSKAEKRNSKKKKEDKNDNINLRNTVKDINHNLIEQIDDFNNDSIYDENKEVNEIYEEKKKKKKKGKIILIIPMGPYKQTNKEQNKINDNQNKLGNISYDKKNNSIHDEELSINSNSDGFLILTDDENEKINLKDNYDNNELSQNNLSNNEDNLNYSLYKKEFSNCHDENFINSKIKEMDIINKQLFPTTSSPPYECTNCNIFLKEITTRNYLNFSTLNEYINQSEHNLLLLKNKKIDQLEKLNKNIMHKMKQLKKENTFLLEKLKYFQTNFINLDINVNKLIEENKILKSINEDLQKKVHMNEAPSSNDEEEKKTIRKNKKERAKGKDLFENSIDKDIFSDT